MRGLRRHDVTGLLLSPELVHTGQTAIDDAMLGAVPNSSSQFSLILPEGGGHHIGTRLEEVTVWSYRSDSSLSVSGSGMCEC